MIACYVRCSTKRQKTDSQKAEIQKWLDGHGIESGHVAWYEDYETGKTLKRESFEQLQKDIFNGRIKTVIVFRLDRLSRRLKDGVNLLADWCEQGIRIVVITQQIELNGAVGRMIAAVMLGLAEIELEYRQERQIAGIAVAKKRGVYRGRKKGSTKAKPKRACELRGRGLTVPEIAHVMGIGERTVYRYLKESA